MSGDTKNKLTLSKTFVFVIEKYVEDVKQDAKHVPDLLESIMFLCKRRVMADSVQHESI